MYSWQRIRGNTCRYDECEGRTCFPIFICPFSQEFVCSRRCNLITKGVPVLVHDAFIAMNHCSNSKEYQGGQSDSCQFWALIEFDRPVMYCIKISGSFALQLETIILWCTPGEFSRTIQREYPIFISNKAYRGQINGQNLVHLAGRENHSCDSYPHILPEHLPEMPISWNKTSL